MKFTVRGRHSWEIVADRDASPSPVQLGASRVLDWVSLGAAGGEFITLLGTAGCGKTTLLRAICGFAPGNGFKRRRDNHCQF